MLATDLGIGAILAAVGIYVGGSVGVGELARHLQRSSLAWLLLSLIFSPFISFIFLMVAGIPAEPELLEERKREKERQERVGRAGFECPRCGAAMNYINRDGFYSPSGEPWKVVCNECDAEVVPPV